MIGVPSYRSCNAHKISCDDATPYRRIVAMILLRAIWDLQLKPCSYSPTEDLMDARGFLMSDQAAHLASLIGFDLRMALQRRGLEHERPA